MRLPKTTHPLKKTQRTISGNLRFVLKRRTKTVDHGTQKLSKYYTIDHTSKIVL
ncbi:uncharacterized protein CANTADRAFT_24322 [Suhomyces tanzawaensis NRRL Y-17324]|uniref:Uncharacterized protein n=1 Tax=Suhomyces tanzawaensis NRRL Y-17324 TaxID=984487 RepID=A0A1E4SPJ9_9ASCO|nr:uncharacterized protein CANTADRAFT_24322 [Suhomyces tanzawaensis NRRL Y-17324]ODV81347.1 hypothetical protein CANTADRAFT_24322 [Suhomyces tanzawaensis NRRL Y-17324]